ncbi:hypothetical protein ACPA74_38085, partial [Uniformispora flossi]
MLTEDRFKDLLNAELDASPGPPMPGIADRAAAGGRRRARRLPLGGTPGADPGDLPPGGPADRRGQPVRAA